MNYDSELYEEKESATLDRCPKHNSGGWEGGEGGSSSYSSRACPAFPPPSVPHTLLHPRGHLSPPPRPPFPPLCTLCALHWGPIVPRPPYGGSGGVRVVLWALPAGPARLRSCRTELQPSAPNLQPSAQIFIPHPQISIPEPHTLQGWSRAGFIPSVGSSVLRWGLCWFRGVNNSRSELVH